MKKWKRWLTLGDVEGQYKRLGIKGSTILKLVPPKGYNACSLTIQWIRELTWIPIERCLTFTYFVLFLFFSNIYLFLFYKNRSRLRKRINWVSYACQFVHLSWEIFNNCFYLFILNMLFRCIIMCYTSIQ